MACGPTCSGNCQCGEGCMCDSNCQCGCNQKPSPGLGAYSPVPPFGQHGFRLGIPGGPQGGQFHGRVSANPSDLAYHGGIAHNLTVPGGAPHNWASTILRQQPYAQYYHDPIYRAPGELPPRPNAAGDLNIFSEPHMPAVPGYAMVPGGLFPTSSMGIENPHAAITHAAQPRIVRQHPRTAPYAMVRAHRSRGLGATTAQKAGPTYQPVGPERITGPAVPVSLPPTNVTTVPPPGTITSPAPVINAPTLPSNGMCPPGTYLMPGMSPNCPPGELCSQLMTAASCQPTTAQPSPVVSASTAGTPSAGQTGCITGEYDMYGNCITSTVPGETSDTGDWFTDPTQDVITGLPNWALTLGAGAAFLLLMQSMKKK
jgi:hypothetical protein